MRVLHTFGDSHRNYIVCRLNPNINAIKHNAGWAYTMSRFGLEKLDLINIKNCGVNEGDAVCFCFGEIDCRSHLGKPQNFKNYKTIIDEIVSRYFKAIRENVDQYKILTTLVYNVVPPCEVTKEVLLHYNKGEEYPFVGSNKKRRKITLYLNLKLKEYCKKYNYIFFDVYDKYCDKKGYLNPKYKDGHVHIINGIFMSKFLKNVKWK